ncbi:MAG TPA: trypsin-like peptidase domain-containing protein [Cerasibacillus sp.]|uniref:S1C family serine protease n=1 Tax=Cerasibacillus sp. TaxID=2498711 RepID=UPI002F3EE285
MGYYDDHAYPRKQKRNWLTPLLLGMIIGILLVAMVKPAVFRTVDESSTDEDAIGINRNPSVTNVKLDVTTQMTDTVEQVAPAVVGVTNLQLQRDLWNPQAEASEAGTGSGVIYKKDDTYGYIVTNHHVIEGADEIEIILHDDTSIRAELLGSDLFSDLAVLRVDKKYISHIIEIGSSESVKVGEPVIAVGNPLGHMFAGSVTQGIISGKQRTIPQDFNRDGRPDWQAEVIQTDAAINPGNSGGALINIAGQLIGINSMKINEAAVEGIGFSIPIDTAQPIMDELETTGTVTRPYLGVEIYSLDEVPRSEWYDTLKLPKELDGGVYIWSIERFSPADRAGLNRLDVITALDGKEVNDIIQLRKILYQEKSVGDEVLVTYYRDGKKQETKLILGKQE